VKIRETSIGPDAIPSVLYIDKPVEFFICEKRSESIPFSSKLIDPSK